MNSYQRIFGRINNILNTTNSEAISKAVTEYGAVTIDHDVYSLINRHALFKNASYNASYIDMSDYIDTSIQFGWIKKKENQLSMEATKFINEVNKVLQTSLDTSPDSKSIYH